MTDMKITFLGDNIVIVSEKGIFINNDQVSTPKGMDINSISIVNDEIYIGGYKYFSKTKTFKRTLKALYHHYLG